VADPLTFLLTVWTAAKSAVNGYCTQTPMELSWWHAPLHDLACAFYSRLAIDNLFKIALLCVFLSWALFRIGAANGIKGGKSWNRVEVRGKSSLRAGLVRLPRLAGAPDYRGRIGTIEFRLSDPPQRSLWRKFVGLLMRPKPLHKMACTFTIPFNGPINSVIYVDMNTAAIIVKKICGKYLDDENLIEKVLSENPIDATAKRANSLRFLLHHPDAALKTTAWVVLTTLVFEIFRSFIYGS
jgi:hypothetical protein